MAQLIEFIGNHSWLSLLWLVVALLLANNLLRNRFSRVKHCSPQQITLLLNHKNASLIDIRPQAEFNKGHILGAVNLPFSQFADKRNTLEKYRKNPLILVCVSGLQAQAASKQLIKDGFTDLHLLDGGINAWTSANLPLERS